MSTMNEFYRIRENLSVKCEKMTPSELKAFFKAGSDKALNELAHAEKIGGYKSAVTKRVVRTPQN